MSSRLICIFWFIYFETSGSCVFDILNPVLQHVLIPLNEFEIYLQLQARVIATGELSAVKVVKIEPGKLNDWLILSQFKEGFKSFLNCCMAIFIKVTKDHWIYSTKTQQFLRLRDLQVSFTPRIQLAAQLTSV